MSQIHILNLIRTMTDGSDQTDCENFVGASLDEAYKKTCEYLHDYEIDLMEELNITLPTQSIDFITDSDKNIYQEVMYRIIEEVMSMGSCHYDIDTVTLDAVIENNKIKEINFLK